MTTDEHVLPADATPKLHRRGLIGGLAIGSVALGAGAGGYEFQLLLAN